MSYPNSQANPAAAIPVWIAPAPGSTTKNITTNAGTLVKTGSGVALGLSVNTGESGATVKLYDGTDNTGVLLGTWDASAVTSLTFPAGGFPFTVGLFVVTAGGTPPADVTVSYL